MQTDPITQRKRQAQRLLDAEAGPDLASFVAAVSRRVRAMEAKYGVRLHYASVVGEPLACPHEPSATAEALAEDRGRYDAP
jgi:hypothetical protein